MKAETSLKNIYFGRIPDGVIVKVWFRIKNKTIDWAIWSDYDTTKEKELR